MIRKTIFWAHLVSGVLAGLVIFMMSLTGVILTYERQIENWFARADYLPVSQQTTQSLPIESLLDLGLLSSPEFTPSSVVITNDPGAPVSLNAGRSGSIELNPYSGETMHTGNPSLEAFFSAVTGWHRWFNVSGENRANARAITGISNLIFLFLILSGMYLWLPKIWRWSLFKARLLFIGKAANAQARDFNWHHVFGIWSAIPLVFIVATATVFNYSWANNLVYQVFGEEAPQRDRGPAAADNISYTTGALTSHQRYMNLDELVDSAKRITEQELGHWQSISMSLPSASDDVLNFSVNQSIGGQPHKQFNLSLDRSTGVLLSMSGLSDQSPGQRTRSIIRFLHTGEVLGFWGQTLAGLVSFASLFMVWTGFALAYRRLIQPWFRRN
tara:strand:- start:5969 stop:7126 length:1158 start_codon:yes stop_codon:yes gene_type:complete